MLCRKSNDKFSTTPVSKQKLLNYTFELSSAKYKASVLNQPICVMAQPLCSCHPSLTIHPSWIEGLLTYSALSCVVIGVLITLVGLWSSTPLIYAILNLDVEGHVYNHINATICLSMNKIHDFGEQLNSEQRIHVHKCLVHISYMSIGLL